MRPRNDAEYWSARASEHGERAALHLGHAPEEVSRVTEMQKEILLPCLRSQLDGTEEVILDFGCGPGRFTASLAETIGGRAIGVDPTAELLRLAPAAPRVEYRLLEEGRIPLPDASVDVVWSAIVLGCITREESVRLAASEIKRVLKPGGLFFLVENTTERKSTPHFIFRSIAAYEEMFHPIPLALLSSYDDLDQAISVLAGRSPRGDAAR